MEVNPMGQLNNTGMRKLTASMADYECYVKCNYLTGYSKYVGMKSDKLEPDDSIPNHDDFALRLEQSETIDRQLGCYELVYVTEDGKVVAYSDLRYDKNVHTLQILEFIMAQEYQLNGYGKKFYQEIEQKAKENGIVKIYVQTSAYGAISFWHKMGFYGHFFFSKTI